MRTESVIMIALFVFVRSSLQKVSNVFFFGPLKFSRSKMDPAEHEHLLIIYFSFRSILT